MNSYRLRDPLPEEISEKLASYPELLRELLYARGVLDAHAAELFLNPDYQSGSHDPFLMSDMQKAVDRVLKAIAQNEKIAIYSDYDADGIPGAVALHDTFRKIGFHNFVNYIPHRHTEGFGVHAEAVEELSRQGVTLLITIDCGIADVAEVKHAITLGMEVIITDHHLPGASVPAAYAILNPKKAECAYPEKMLCGSGVIFKFIQALLVAHRKCSGGQTVKEGWEKWLLDMVGLATLSDMVPLTGENRVLARYGLMVLRKSPRVGLQKLLAQSKADQKNLTEDDIGFTISPRINAASRMGVPMEAFRLLATNDETEADMLSRHLDEINNERKGLVAATVKEIKHIIKEREQRSCNLIVLGNPKWRPALLGLVANSLMQEHSCPVFLWGRDGGTELKGSCRSDGSVNLLELMRSAQSGVFHEYGGHHMSGGFSVPHDKVHVLEEELERAYEKVRQSSFSKQEVFIDRNLSLEEVDWNTYRALEVLAPFGLGNPKPLFMFQSVIPEEVKPFGKEKNHLELVFKKKNGKLVKAIAFFARAEQFARRPEKGTPINLVAHLEQSTFRGFKELRLRIIDVM